MHCDVCGKEFDRAHLRDAATVRPAIAKLVHLDMPEWNEESKICVDDLSAYRRQYVALLLEQGRGELGKLDYEVLESVASGGLITSNLADLIEEKFSFPDRAADKIAKFGGSWVFILSFSVIILIWVSLNVTALLLKPFDPYPFILLNLLLSCIAAMQAPVIMMSQRRVEEKDRLRAENDYKINLKAELEIRQLHEKLDHQLANQWQRMLEIQEIQIDMLSERAES